jgi:hypothetical protein
MANQFTIYKSSDASAPVLNGGAVGTLITVLDAVLVNGYGTKAAAGWSKAFSTANIGVYRAPSGVRNYLRVDDSDGVVRSAGKIAAYETMSDVNTGTHSYSASSPLLLTGNNNPATWLIAADAVTFMMFVLASGSPAYYGFVFGEFFSLVSNDSYRSFLRAASSNTLANTSETMDVMSTVISSATSAGFGVLDRGHTGVGAAVNASFTGDTAKSGSSTTLFGAIPFPNPSDGGAYLSPVWISDPTTSPANGIRGRMRGFWQWLHPIASVSDGDTLSGTGDLAGKTFLILKPSPHSGVVVLETSATLETN